MKILQENPPFISEARDVFRLPEGVVFTFGDTIFNPSGRLIDEHLYAHEEHHSKQQGNSPKDWWTRYLKDPAFRASQEIPAYTIQFRSAKKSAKDRNKLHRYAVLLAKDLSGPMYGEGLLSFQDAYDAITGDKLYDFDTKIMVK